MESILDTLNHDESKGKERDDEKEQEEDEDKSEEEERLMPNIPLAGGAVLTSSPQVPENLTSDVDEEEEEHGIMKRDDQVIHDSENVKSTVPSGSAVSMIKQNKS